MTPAQPLPELRNGDVRTDIPPFTFQPRIVRGTDSGIGHRTTRNRRSSSSAGTVPLGGYPRKSSISSSGGLFSPHGAPHSSSTAIFPRPAYLDHSALRRFIQTSPGTSSRLQTSPYPDAHQSPTPFPRRQPPGTARRRVSIYDSDDESVTSDGDRQAVVPPPEPIKPPAKDVILIPTRFSELDRWAQLTLSPDGREVQFNGSGSQGEREAAAVRTDFPMPRACGVYYFEVEILQKGQKGHIGIGFGTKSVQLNRLPGWEEESWGYHGDDGHSFASQAEGSPYGPKFTTGDIIGCGVDFCINRAFYTKNGAFQGHLFNDLKGDLYPMIGLRTQNETIRANFGQQPFQFDIDSYVQQQQNAAWSTIQTTPVTWSQDHHTFLSLDDPVDSVPPHSSGDIPRAAPDHLGSGMNQLVHDYLTHHGYARAAEALKSAMVSQRPGPRSDPSPSADSMMVDTAEDDEAFVDEEEEDVFIRQRISVALRSGDVDLALNETRTHYPSAIDAQDGLMLFKLRCRKFIELTLETAAALKAAKKLQMASVPPLSPISINEKGVIGNGRNNNNGTSPSKITRSADDMDVDDEDREIDESLQQISSPTLPPMAVSISISSPPPPPSLKLKQKEKQHADALPLPLPLPSTAPVQAAFENALACGKALHAEYVHDSRPEVKALFSRTMGLLAYESPLEAGGDVSKLAGQSAREELARELNEAILRSQGKPDRPALQMVYRQAATVVLELGLAGSGMAAYADVEKEYSDL